MRKNSTIDRDQALRRLRRATSMSLAAAGALVAAFAGLAAKALPGRHAVKATTVQTARSTASHTTTHAQATPPPLVQAQSAATPAAPAAPPAQTQAPPVVVSGGS